MKKQLYAVLISVSAIFSILTATPDIVTDPDRILASALPGSTDTESFSLINAGTSDLTYNAAISYTSKKDAKGGGGPDSYGYEWRDSDAPDGPVYNWIEINTFGTVVSLTDELLSPPIPLGFTFNFYGTDFTSVKVCSNGFLSFTTTTNTALNETIPSASEPNNLLALMWDDLNPAAAGSGFVYYYSDTVNKRFIVEYSGIPHYGSTSLNYAQVILYESGRIVYQYKNVGDVTITSSTVGIKNSTGLVGLQVVKNYSYLKNNLAIQFSAVPKWLSLSSYSGVVPASSNTQINAVCSAAGLDYGTYTADVKISSNDPDQPLKILPVTFIVSDVTSWPDIELNPVSLSESVMPGNSVQDTFGITNSGNSDLVYSLTTSYEVIPENITVSSNDFNSGLGNWVNSGGISWVWTTNTNNLDGTSYLQALAHTSGGGTKSSIITSAPFDGTSCSQIYLNFYQYAVFTQSSGTVEYTSDGTNWITVYTKNTNIGGWGTPNFQKILLPVISPTMQVRFTGVFTKLSGDMWNIDNVSVSGPEVITLSWLSIDSPVSGTVVPSGVKDILFTCDSSGLAEGVYYAGIKVESNDPDEAIVIIPVEFIVTTGTSLGTPANVLTSVAGSVITISWDTVAGAASYDVYSSDSPYGTFAFLANVSTEQYSFSYTEPRKFYYIIARN